MFRRVCLLVAIRAGIPKPMDSREVLVALNLIEQMIKFQIPSANIQRRSKHQTSKVQKTDKMSDKAVHLKSLEMVHNWTILRP